MTAALTLLAACSAPQPPPIEPPERVIEVTTNSGGTGGAECTLRDAVAAANADAAVGACPAGEGDDVIVLPEGRLIKLAVVAEEADGPNGLPSVTSAIEIRGNGATIARAEDGADLRLFHVASGGSLVLKDVTVADGYVRAHDGGGIFVAGGSLRVEESVVEGNRVGPGLWGGAIHNAAGRVELVRTLLRFNSAPGEVQGPTGFVPGTGSAVANVGGHVSVSGSELVFNGAFLTGERGALAAIGIDSFTEVTDTKIVDNDSLGVYNEGELRMEAVELARSANLSAGGIVNTGVAFLTDVVVSRNEGEFVSGVSNAGYLRALRTVVSGHRAMEGFGGVLNEGIMHLVDSEVTGNVGPLDVGHGGGITNHGALLLLRSSVTGNSAVVGGGVLNTGELELAASVVDGNEAQDGAGIHTSGPVLLSGGAVVGGDEGNSASGSGGGIYVADLVGSRVTVEGASAVVGNTAGVSGGGIHSEGELELALCSECEVAGNAVTGAGPGAGGGIYAPAMAFATVYAPGISGNSPDQVAPGVLTSVAVALSADDAEEIGSGSANAARPTGAVFTAEPALSLRFDPAASTSSHVGLRFDVLDVPPDAVLIDARVAFTAAASTAGRGAVTVRVQDDPAAASFVPGEASFDLTSRSTLGTAYWSLPAWTAGDSGPAQATPSLRNQVQQLISDPTWSAAASVAVILSPADGDQSVGRQAVSVDADPAAAARLWLLYYPPVLEPAPDEP